MSIGFDAKEREIGRVTSVSNYKVTVLLNPEVRSQVRAYPEHIALVTQIGGYVLFPVTPGESAVGIVVGASEDEAIEPDGDRLMTLQLTRARRTLRINLLGQLWEGKQFVTGVSVYPSLGTPALLPTESELVCILEYKPTDPQMDVPLDVGVSPIYARHAVTVSFNDSLSRPLGVIGNTGSGKSYSVASIIQRALEIESQRAVQAKVIILDVNGEYLSAFQHPGTSREHAKRALNKVYVNGKEFTLPLWAFNLNEMVSFFGASQSSQEPVLERVITSLREHSVDPEPARRFRLLARAIEHCQDCLGSLVALAAEVDGKAVCDNAADVLRCYTQYRDTLKSQANGILELPEKITSAETLEGKLSKSGLKSTQDYKKLRGNKDYEGFQRMEPNLAKMVETIVDELEPEFEHLRTRVITQGALLDVTADSPIPLNPSDLDREAPFRIAITRFRGQERIQEYIATLRLRIHRQLVDKRWSVFTTSAIRDIGGLYTAIIRSDSERVIVVDCSMLAHDVLPFFCAVFGRLLLDLRERAKPEERSMQPYVLILEEAHNYLKPKLQEEALGLRLARESFERIAKEGRKFGLSLVIASQRPSDVSATVLSQCANFLVHRIQNPEDIDYFKKILPTGSRDLLDQLPILAPGDGLFLGSALNVPARVKIHKPNPTPSSETCKPWHTWQRDSARFDYLAAVGTWLNESRTSGEETTTDDPMHQPVADGAAAKPKDQLGEVKAAINSPS